MIRARNLGVLVFAVLAVALTLSMTQAQTAPPGLPDQPSVIDVTVESGVVGFVHLIVRTPAVRSFRIPGPIDIRPVNPKLDSVSAGNRTRLTTTEPTASGMGGGFVAPSTSGAKSVDSARRTALSALDAAGRELGLR